jgi:alkanesulfonate monooxygenase SsuD/methylene tetrahydromethanopterin reductase-like flavin-dependent oxidoreductase (luciferase family)
MPVLAELYAVVGDEEEALAAAPLWQFGPVMGELISEPDPRGVQRRAAELSSPERTVRSWAIGRDPAVHIRRIEELFGAGATQVYVHSAQPDQLRVIQFYAREVLPALSRPGRA